MGTERPLLLEVGGIFDFVPFPIAFLKNAQKNETQIPGVAQHSEQRAQQLGSLVSSKNNPRERGRSLPVPPMAVLVWN